MLDKLIDYIRNFDFKGFIDKIKNRNIKEDIKQEKEKLETSIKNTSEEFVHRRENYKLHEWFNFEKYTSFIDFKIVAYIFLVIIVLVCILFLIKLTGMYVDNRFEKFEKNIDLVQSKIVALYDSGEKNIGKGTSDLAKNFWYKWKIKKINKLYNIDLTDQTYYFLDKEEKEKLGLSELKDEYIVSYEKNQVFCLKPVRYEGKKHYTSRNIENSINGVATYDMPPIPNGFRHVEGIWNTGFVIKDDYGNEFVWIPVGYLNNIDPVSVLRQYYRSYESKTEETYQYLAILDSIRRYQGFYIGRYEASLQGATSENSQGKNNVLQVVKGVMPVSNMSLSTDKSKISSEFENWMLYGYDENGQNSNSQYAKGAIELATDMQYSYDWGNNGVHTALIYAEQYDTALKIIELLDLLDDKKVDNLDPIKQDSTNWGNYMNSIIKYKVGDEYITKNTNESILLPTGTQTYNVENEEETNSNKVFNIYDLAGNLSEWSMDKMLDKYNHIRGGNFCSRGNNLFASSYAKQYQALPSSSIGIRVVLYID